MKIIKSIFLTISLLVLTLNAQAQCKHTLIINSSDAICNGNNTSTVTINVTVLFGNGGNNSAVLSYNLGAGEVNAVVLEDDAGDIINTTYMFNVPSCGNFPVTLTGWTNPSGSGSSCTDPAPVTTSIILPVTFGHFDLSKNEKSIVVEWSTLTETNNEKFVIQRAEENGEFKNIGELEGAVNSLTENYYRFTDNNISSGMHYYRIQQIDLDGQFSFSDVKMVNVKTSSDLLVYPNPATENITISTSSSHNFKLVDGYGQVIGIIQNNSKYLGYDTSPLKSGLYYIVSLDNTEKISFIKL